MKHPWLQTPEYIECRTLTGHRWFQLGKEVLEDASWHYVHRCRVCRGERHSLWHWITGKLVHRWYEMEEGYYAVLEGKEKKLTQVETRALYFKTRRGKGRSRKAA